MRLKTCDLNMTIRTGIFLPLIWHYRVVGLSVYQPYSPCLGLPPPVVNPDGLCPHRSAQTPLTCSTNKTIHVVVLVQEELTLGL